MASRLRRLYPAVMTSPSQELHQALADQRLLAWYDGHRRHLPWRERPEPWRVLVSELMLQQTQVSTVLPRYETFMDCFPSPAAMAAAGEEAVLSQWAGLGYYRRARALYAIAKILVAEHEGSVPGDFERLKSLPGVGAYTAAAVASIAFAEPVGLVDGNVERVLSRLLGEAGELRNAVGKRRLEAWAQDLVSSERPGDHNQALMELGARICRPLAPRCSDCPLQAVCLGQAKWREIPNLPKRPTEVPVLEEDRYLLLDPLGQMAWRRRPETGLYSKMADLPDDWSLVGEAEPLGTALVERRLSHRLLRLKGQAYRLTTLPPEFELGSVEEFMAAGPPKAVALLMGELLGPLLKG